MKNELIYILKRVIIGVLIAIILFSIKSCQVKALEVGPSGYYLPDNAIFYNNISTTNSVAVSTDYTGTDYQNLDLIRTVPNNQNGNGASVCIATPYTLVNGYIYSISILMANNHAAPYDIVTKDNYTYVRAGYSAQDAANRLNSAKITYFNSNYVPNLGYGPAYALGYMITIVGGNYNYVCLPFTTNTTLDSTHAFYGVLFEQVGNSNEVTQNQLNSAMNNINSSIVSVNNTIAAGNAAIQADITNQSNFLQSILNGKILEVIQNQEQNTQDIIEEQQNTTQAIEDLNDSITSETPPNLSSLNNSAGWLPAGPVDSILNLPLALLNNINTNLSKTCQPVILHIPLVDRDLPIPCITTLYEQMGIMTWVNTIGAIASAFILFSYFVKLYKWVDDTLTFRENNYIDNWGGV